MGRLGLQASGFGTNACCGTRRHSRAKALSIRPALSRSRTDATYRGPEAYNLTPVAQTQLLYLPICVRGWTGSGKAGELRGTPGGRREGGGPEGLRYGVGGRPHRAAQRPGARGLRDERGAGEREGLQAQPEGGGREPGLGAGGALPAGGRGRRAWVRELLALGRGVVRGGRGAAGGGGPFRAQGARGEALHA